jgi:hypothetical protein
MLAAPSMSLIGSPTETAADVTSAKYPPLTMTSLSTLFDHTAGLLLSCCSSRT